MLLIFPFFTQSIIFIELYLHTCCLYSCSQTELLSPSHHLSIVPPLYLTVSLLYYLPISPSQWVRIHYVQLTRIIVRIFFPCGLTTPIPYRSNVRLIRKRHLLYSTIVRGTIFILKNPLDWLAGTCFDRKANEDPRISPYCERWHIPRFS